MAGFSKDENQRDAMAPGRADAHPRPPAQAHHRARARRGLRRRRGPGRLLRHRRGHRRRATFSLSEVRLGLDPRRDLALRDRRHRRARRRAATSSPASASTPPRPSAWASCTRSRPTTSATWTTRSAQIDRRAARVRPGRPARGEGADPRGGEQADAQRADPGHRRAHRAHPLLARGPRGRRGLPREAQAPGSRGPEVPRAAARRNPRPCSPRSSSPTAAKSPAA